MTPTDITLATVQAVFAYRSRQHEQQYEGCKAAIAALRNTPDSGKIAITAAPPSPRAALLARAQAPMAAKPKPKPAPISRPEPRPPGQATRPVILKDGGAPQMLSAAETLAAAFPDATSRPSAKWLRDQAYRGAIPSQTIAGAQLFDVARVKALVKGEPPPARLEASQLTTAEHWTKYQAILEQHGRQAASGYYKKHIAR
jgi:hypothetical protein